MRSNSRQGLRLARGEAGSYRPRDDAFTLVTLAVLVTVLNIVVAAALPVWSQQIKRDKEEELIFRGLQYAEAIRIFQKRVGRYPLRLEELIEIEPRSIRQLWKDPMTEDGEWGLMFAAAGGARQPGQEAVNDAAEDAFRRTGSGRNRRERRNTGLDGDTVTTGPISGVHSKSNEESVKTFLGGRKYSEWIFVPEMLPIAPTAPGVIVPSLNSRWIGRPLPEGLEPQSGTGLDDPFAEEGEETREQPSDDRRSRRRGNRNRG